MSNPIPLPPFKAFLASNIPSVYDNTLSYYDELTKLIAYIEQVLLPAVEQTAGEVDGIKDGLIELKKYVDEYFDNLDVQEEINNKLDDMATSGQLATIIDQFVNLGVLFTYDTLEDLKDAENLIAGCTCQTFGKETLNDGFGAYYKIDTTGDIALDNGLYATLIPDFGGNNYYDEITITTGRANSTDFYVATIPMNDADGNMIVPYVNDETDNPVDSPLQYADKELTTITLNAGLGRLDSNDQWQQMAVISNGVITHRDLNDITAPEWYSYIGIKADRSLVDFPGTTNPETMLAAGVVNAFSTFGQVITNGSLTINEHWDDSGNHPLVYLGEKNDGTMIIFVCDGRTDHDTGFTIQQGAGYMLTLGCVNAWRLDSGGSSSLIYKGSKQNRNIDDNGTKDRNIWVSLNFKKETIDKELAKAYSFIGKERQLLNKQIRDDYNAELLNHNSLISLFNTNTGYNIISDGLKVMEFGNLYRHANYITSVFEEGATRASGFKVKKIGLVKVNLSGYVKCANTAGVRSLRIVSRGTENMPGSGCLVLNTFNPTAANEYYEVSGTCVFVNSTEGNEFQILAGGVAGDDFSRLYCQAEYIGSAA